MQNFIPRFVLAGLSGGTGKTIISLALARAFTLAGKKIAPFKKGPDYIDAQWLGLATGRACSNLDPFFHSEEVIRTLFWHKSKGLDLSIVEGNRGLFDGKDEHGSCSTAELARMLGAPVVLAIDCTKMTRTVAAIVQGCTMFESDMNLAGVILNRTAGERHRSILKKSLEKYTDIPVLGMLPKILKNPIPERHMGLMSDQEFDGCSGSEQKVLDSLAAMASEWLDMDAILSVANSAPDFGPEPGPLFSGEPSERKVQIGYVHDSALWFYYPENLEALEHAGADLVKLSLLSDEPWPKIDGLYLGGGFPEIFAKRISENKAVLDHIRSLSKAGLPIYAECGGFMILCETLEHEKQTYPMAGVFPIGTTFCPKPQGLGYTKGEVLTETPFFQKGTIVLGHEFHYSACKSNSDKAPHCTLKMLRGKGGWNGRDGVLYKNTIAGYNHIHALAVPQWAKKFVAAAGKKVS